MKECDAQTPQQREGKKKSENESKKYNVCGFKRLFPTCGPSDLPSPQWDQRLDPSHSGLLATV